MCDFKSCVVFLKTMNTFLPNSYLYKASKEKTCFNAKFPLLLHLLSRCRHNIRLFSMSGPMNKYQTSLTDNEFKPPPNTPLAPKTS